MYKIGICGAHGTGKTTLGNLLSQELNLVFITNTMRSMWTESGVSDFEKLPTDIRSQFQKHAIIRQINRENIEGKSGFITDRTVVDNLSYTKLSSSMDTVDLALYTSLVLERLNNYTHFIYLPIMFEAPSEFLRADISSRENLAKIIEEIILNYVSKEKLLIIKSLDNEDRMVEILKFLK